MRSLQADGARRDKLWRVAVFVVLGLTLQACVELVERSAAAGILERATARAGGRLLALAGLPVGMADGATILLPSRAIGINVDCTGITAFAAFVPLLLVVPAPWWRKTVGLVVGLLSLAAVNLARLVATGWVSERAPAWFPLVHDGLFRVVLVWAVLALWALWVWWARATEVVA